MLIMSLKNNMVISIKCISKSYCIIHIPESIDYNLIISSYKLKLIDTLT